MPNGHGQVPPFIDSIIREGGPRFYWSLSMLALCWAAAVCGLAWLFGALLRAIRHHESGRHHF